MGFETPLQTEPIARRKWRLIAPLIYRDEQGRKWVVPKGRVTDFASTWEIPLVAEWFDGLAPMSATLHDMLYDGTYNDKVVTRKEADDLFFEAMSHENNWYKSLGFGEAISNIERHAMHEGVKIGGVSAFRGEHDGYISDEAKKVQEAF